MKRIWKFRIYQGAGNLWRWTLYASNGKIIADSAEGYRWRSHAVRMVEKLQGQIADARVEIEG